MQLGQDSDRLATLEQQYLEAQAMMRQVNNSRADLANAARHEIATGTIGAGVDWFASQAARQAAGVPPLHPSVIQKYRADQRKAFWQKLTQRLAF